MLHNRVVWNGTYCREYFYRAVLNDMPPNCQFLHSAQLYWVRRWHFKLHLTDCTIQEIVNLVFQIGWFTVHFIAAMWFLLYFMLNCSFAQLFLGAFEWKAETENVSIQHADSFCLFTESPEIFCESPEICRISKALFSLQGLAGQDLKTLSNIPSFKKCFNSFLWSSCHSCWCDDNDDDNNADDDTDDGYV